MKKWVKPQLRALSFRQTEAGIMGGDADWVVYDIVFKHPVTGREMRGKLIGTSGDPI